MVDNVKMVRLLLELIRISDAQHVGIEIVIVVLAQVLIAIIELQTMVLGYGIAGTQRVAGLLKTTLTMIQFYAAKGRERRMLQTVVHLEARAQEVLALALHVFPLLRIGIILLVFCLGAIRILIHLSQ